MFLNDYGLPILLLVVDGLEPNVGRYSKGVVGWIDTLELFLLLFFELNFLRSLKLLGLPKPFFYLDLESSLPYTESSINLRYSSTDSLTLSLMGSTILPVNAGYSFGLWKSLR